MNSEPAQEPLIDVSLNHYMEERALSIAREKTTSPAELDAIDRLLELRSALMQHRELHMKEAVAKRHARGEVYSATRVAAINSMAPSKAELDKNVRSLYLRQPSSRDVLKAHARTHFAHSLVSARLLLADMPADISGAARLMQEHEERFAKAWVGAVGDPEFDRQLREDRRQALALFRTASRAMYLVTHPAREVFDDVDARELGRVWGKLDKLSESMGLAPLSRFIAFDDEGDTAGAPATELVQLMESLLTALSRSDQKFPSKRAAIALLTKMRDGLAPVSERGGRAHFEVDV